MSGRTAWQLTAFVAGIAVVFGGGLLIGNRVPVIAVAAESDAGHAGDRVDDNSGDEMGDDMSEGSAGHDAGHDAGADAGHAARAVGVAVSQDGYTLEMVSADALEPGRSQLRFRIIDDTGSPVTDYVAKHQKDLHLILVSSDLAVFRHVHPQLSADGVWSVRVDLGQPGNWRMYADFTPGATDRALVLATQLTVTGDVAPQPLPGPTTVAAVAGYRVSLAGHADAGTETELTFRISRGDAVVNDLDPYLGADGHLVAIRQGDLAYLHTHPQAHEPTGGPDVTFATTFPTAGRYRVFLDFSHAGTVHTAAFTVDVGRH